VPGTVRRALGLGEQDRVLPVSARTGKGINELWQEIESFLRVDPGTVEKEHHG